MIESVIAGLLVTVFGALAVYAFRTKQLYLVMPQLFSSSQLSQAGKIVELRIFNKGRGAESDVQIGLDPAAEYEVVASTDSTCSIIGATLSILRVPPGDDYSILVLVEGGDLTAEKISGVSSTTTKGKVLSSLADVPPNAGNAVLAALGVCLLLGIPFAGIHAYETWADRQEQARLEDLKDGLERQWANLERYAKSEFSAQYAAGEFPIHVIEKSRDGQRVAVKFKIINRAAAPLEVTVKTEWPYRQEDPEPWNSTHYETINVPPDSSTISTAVFYWPSGETGKANLEFSMTVGNDTYLSAATEVEIDV